jgi:isopenicillin N synthase-like dioxygenase
MAPASVVPRISLADFDSRREEIVKELMDAATDIGFFSLVDHGIPSSLIQDAFALSESFFGLPDPVKAKTPHNGKNCGWEKQAQVGTMF